MSTPELAEPSALGMLFGALGKVLVLIGCGAFLFSAVLSVAGDSNKRGGLLASVTFWVATGCTVATFAVLIGLILGSQYQFAYVFENSDNAMPLAFRISAAWASQEGSFLLWTSMSAVAGAVVFRISGSYRRWFLVAFGAVMAAKLGILANESPFELLGFGTAAMQSVSGEAALAVPADGLGMNLLLQNYWMVIHPLVIFAGFGALTPLFCWALSAALSDDWHLWAVLARPFTIAAMALLGVGLLIGGLWAYETLGWGGFWAWDPVENAALVPWIAVVVLMHGFFVQVNRGRWVRVNLLMGALPFVLFVYGTFLTRSGVLVDVSVHSFAEMNEGAYGLLLWLLRALLVLILVGTGYVFSRPIRQRCEDKATVDPGRKALVLWVAVIVSVLTAVALWAGYGGEPGMGVKAAIVCAACWAAVAVGCRLGSIGNPASVKAEVSEIGQRGQWLNAGSIVLYSVGVCIAVGMSLPFLSNLFGRQAWVVDEAVYNKSLVVPFVMLMAILGAVPFLGWTSTKRERVKRLFLIFAASIVLAVVPFFVLLEVAKGTDVSASTPLWLTAGIPIWACVFAVLGNTVRLTERLKKRTGGVGANIVHAGLALLLLGLIASRSLGRDEFAYVSVNDGADLFGYSLNLDEEPTIDELAQKDNTLTFDLKQGDSSEQLRPVFYYHMEADGSLHAMTYPYIRRTLTSDLYLTVGSMVGAYSTGVTLSPGETKVVDQFSVTYLESTQTGELGEIGSRVGVSMEVRKGDTTMTVMPELELLAGMSEEHHAAAGEDLKIALHALDKPTGRATISLLLPEPYFSVQLLYRPLTVLVWLGTALIVLGSFIASSRFVGRAKSAFDADLD